jgi:hypothetical protein
MCFRRRVERRGRLAPIEFSRQCLAKKRRSPRDTDHQLTASFIVVSTRSCVCVCVCACVCVGGGLNAPASFNEKPYSSSKVVRTDGAILMGFRQERGSFWERLHYKNPFVSVVFYRRWRIFQKWHGLPEVFCCSIPKMPAGRLPLWS